MRFLPILIAVLLSASLRPAGAAALTQLASSRYAVVMGQPEARSMAPYVARTADRVVPRAAALTGCRDLSRLPIRLYTDAGTYRADAGARGLVFAKAMAGQGVVFVLAESPRSLERLDNALAHEVAHVMVWRTMRPAEQALPLWVNEGVAQRVEGSSSAAADSFAARARRANQLIPIDELVRPAFQGSDIDPDQGRLAYAESLSLVSLLIHRDGEGVIARLLATTRRQGDFALALKEITGLSEDELDVQWRKSLGSGTWAWIALLDPNLLIWAVMALLLVVGVVRYWMVRRRREAESDEKAIEPRERKPLGW